jgi:5-methylthioadenosine/S-adenosylhomocysteine deaminase
MQEFTGAKMSRRNLLAGAATIALMNTKSLAQTQPIGPSATALPQQLEVVIRAAFIMTMDPSLGDLKTGDVHIVNGLIRAVGQNLAAPSAREIDGRDMIALPGFIDTHTHLWSTQMRGRFGDTPETIYFRVRNLLGDGYRADDVYHGTRLGAAESVSAGITTAVDFFHNNRGPDFAHAAIRALKETGLRCRFLLGPSTRTPPNEPMDLATLESLSSSWSSVVGDAPLTLGLAWRGPLGIMTPVPGEPIRPEFNVSKQEFDTARRLKLPITVHVSGTTAKRQFDSLAAGNFLGPDVQLAHFSNASNSDMKIAVEAGSPVSLTPMTELRVGYGVTQLTDYVSAGMKVGLGIDSNSLAGVSDMFTVMKMFQNIEAGRTKNELAVSPRKLLQLATIEGARSIGMDSQIGSITPGKRADVILVNTRALNLAVLADDPTHMLVEAAQPANVDTVVVDGKILKSGGAMLGIDVSDVIRGARQSIVDIAARTQR